MKDIQTELDKPGVNSFGLGDFKAPKVLGDILESIAGALFLDTGLDTNKVWEVSLVCLLSLFSHRFCPALLAILLIYQPGYKLHLGVIKFTAVLWNLGL